MAAVNLVGLDIGAMSIRAVETSRGKDAATITNFGHALLPAGAVSGGAVQNELAVTTALKHLWTTAKFGTRNVVLGVTNPQVVVREMSVSNLPAREMRKSLPFQVRDALPLAVERSLLDFYPLEDPGDAEKVRGLLIAAPKDPVLAAVNAVEKAGLHVVKVDLASFALLRAASRLDTKVEAIADIGADSTTVVVHSDGTPLIVRTIPRGGSEITQTLASRLTISAEEAEALKCRIGVSSTEEPEHADAVRDAAGPLINEIRSSFAYLTNAERPIRVARLALTGGGAQLPGLAATLGTQLNVEVILADPTARLRNPRRGRPPELDRFRSSAAVSLGLTLGAA
jgi:type IV pilus assembly protein PilM